MKRPLHVLVLSLTLVSALAAQEDVVDRIVREGRERGEVMKHLDHITNKIGPRLTSSDNLTKAQEWSKERFEAWGLKNCRLEEWGTFPVGFNRGPWSGSVVSPQKKDLVCATMSWTAGTDGPVTGPAILAPTDVDDVAGIREKLKGAWVLLAGRPPPEVVAECEKAGPAGFVRSSGGDLIVTGGGHRISWDKRPKRVTVYVRGDQFREVLADVKAGKDVQLKFDIKNEFKQGPIKLYNVIAEIPGTEKPDEVVIVGGHIDSWDGATGTTDNGTGTATTIEVARILSAVGAKPKRTIRFMLWSGEEQGLLGSAAWIRRNPGQMDKISAVLVHDGGTNYVSGIIATPSMVPHFEKIFAPAMKLSDELTFKISERKTLPRDIGSDHDAFLAAGVPGFFWNQGRTKAKGQDYTHEHHTQYDLYSAAIPEFQQHSAIVIAIGALGIANLDGMLPRDEAAPSPRQIGVQCDEEDCTIDEVLDDTPAAAAGLKAGDRILKLGDLAIANAPELRAAIKKSKLETTVTILRDGKELTLPVRFPR